jgi:hypothetical protein
MSEPIQQPIVHRTPGWLIIRATEKVGQFVQRMKALPYYDRRWCESIGSWAVRMEHEIEVGQAIYDCFGNVGTRPEYKNDKSKTGKCGACGYTTSLTECPNCGANLGGNHGG